MSATSPKAPAASSPTAPAESSPTAQMRPAAQALGQAFKGCLAAVRRLRGRENRSHGELSRRPVRPSVRSASTTRRCRRASWRAWPTSRPATATEMLDGLAAAGLVARVRSERDRRVVLTSLTGHGRALVEARHAQFAPRWHRGALGIQRRRAAQRGGGPGPPPRDVRRHHAERRERPFELTAGVTTAVQVRRAALGVAHAEGDRPCPRPRRLGELNGRRQQDRPRKATSHGERCGQLRTERRQAAGLGPHPVGDGGREAEQPRAQRVHVDRVEIALRPSRSGGRGRPSGFHVAVAGSSLAGGRLTAGRSARTRRRPAAAAGWWTTPPRPAPRRRGPRCGS